jgi:integral membrane sensor domain MASE1
MLGSILILSLVFTFAYFFIEGKSKMDDQPAAVEKHFQLLPG